MSSATSAQVLLYAASTFSVHGRKDRRSRALREALGIYSEGRGKKEAVAGAPSPELPMDPEWQKECEKRAARFREVSHEQLAEMNNLGFITYGSQEGAGEKEERSYVDGFLPNGMVPTFLVEINRRGFLAWAVPACPIPPGTIRPGVPVTLDQGHPFTWGHMLSTPGEHACVLEEAGLTRFGNEVTMVFCMDATWGRLGFLPDGLFPAVIEALTGPGRPSLPVYQYASM